MAIVGPLVFVAVWPWLWPDLPGRIGGYVAFHLKHYPIYLYFDGEIWERPFAPGIASLWHFLASLPVVTLALAGVGAAQALAALRRIVLGATVDGRLASPRDRLLALALLQGVLSVAVVALNSGPRYGGEKLFMPVYPMVAVLGGVGVVRLIQALGRLSRRPAHDLLSVAGRRRFPVWTVVVVVVVAVPGAVGIARTAGGYGLSYFGELVGGVRGATARGMERTYYDMADKPLATTLVGLQRQRGDRPLKVHFEPNHKEYVRTYRWLERDGVVPRGALQLVSRVEQADVVVLTHERRWKTFPALWRALRDRPILAERRLDGVPLWTIFDR